MFKKFFKPRGLIILKKWNVHYHVPLAVDEVDAISEMSSLRSQTALSAHGTTYIVVDKVSLNDGSSK